MQNKRREFRQCLLSIVHFSSSFCILHSSFCIPVARMTHLVDAPNPPAPSPVEVRARWLLTFFLLTFLLSRIVVLLIMTRRMPDLFLYVGGTHVHHLNYGIVLLSAVGTWALLTTPTGTGLKAALTLFGVGLGLTFDEFGMWVHLGGSYWQRASFDAVVVVAGVLGLIAVGPALRRLRPRHVVTAALLACALVAFAVLLADSFNYAGKRFGPRLEQIERGAPR
jgi:hypothetical protein